MDSDAVFSCLLNNRKGNPIAIASEPGIFAVFVKQTGSLPGIDVPGTGLVYIGEANDLARRSLFVPQGSLASTPWRTLAAILRTRLGLVAVPGAGKEGCQHYRFAGNGETKLGLWIRENLLCSTYRIDSGVGRRRLKSELVLKHEPPLNLKGWANSQAAKIRDLKKLCRGEAERST